MLIHGRSLRLVLPVGLAESAALAAGHASPTAIVAAVVVEQRHFPLPPVNRTVPVGTPTAQPFVVDILAPRTTHILA